MPKGIKRRQFLKWMGSGGVALTTAGCGPEMPDLIPYIRPPDGIVPGEPTFFATTCRECPAGCGMFVKNRDGRVIKAEGNPLHPLNEGRLCPRGQASLTGLYNPDRVREPRQQVNGTHRPIPWSKAMSLVSDRLQQLRRQGRQEKLTLLTPLVTGSLKTVIDESLTRFGSGPEAHIMYEPLAYETLQAANQSVFGNRELPTYRIDQADFLIALGADFLETWLSTVEYARRFAEFHRPGKDRKHFFVYVGPRQSLTAANADRVLLVPPGREYLAGVALLKALAEEGLPEHWSTSQRRMLQTVLEGHTVREAAGQCGVAEEDMRRMARRFREATAPLALAGGNGRIAPGAYPAAVAANLLCAWRSESLGRLDFGQPHAIGAAASAATMGEFSRRLSEGDVEVLLVHDSNPVFSLPQGEALAEALGQGPTVISFSSFEDETGLCSDLHLPAHTFLEAWGDYRPKPGIVSLLQPTMGPVYDTRPFGDLIIAALEGQPLEKAGFVQRLQGAWWQAGTPNGPRADFTRYWIERLRRGGRWAGDPPQTRPPQFSADLDRNVFPQAGTIPSDLFQATVYPTIQFYDGRMANRPWIQELPDPITQATWGGWVEINPRDGERLGLVQGDRVRLTSDHGSIALPVLPLPSVSPGSLAVPIGQGHTHFGRFASGLPANAFRLFASAEIDAHGTLTAPHLAVRLEPLDDTFGVAVTSGSLTDHGRDILEWENFGHYRHQAAAGHKPHITPPLPDGWDPDRDFYGPHVHATYRWGMVVDLDRCIGCGACVTACYAENNVAFVGREQMLKMREMSWIRVQRYMNPEDRRIGWLVMLCQHCDSAPCESVCPIFAPQHSVEGLNNQVYNRCFGTRFCSQNDPYKVRRFNWYTWTRPAPLDMQLNPDVTVRQKGIMEKCSFCIQRIVAAKVQARNEDRPVEDDDFTTACAQTCPTGALIFGNLRNPESRVARLMKDARAYQVLHHLNTKPAVIYLKRLTQEL